MDEAYYAQSILNELEQCIIDSNITDYEVKVATNKRIIVRFNTQHDADYTMFNLKATRRGNGERAPIYQIEKGLKTDLYYLQLRV